MPVRSATLVVDTNVLIGGMLSQDTAEPTWRIVDAVRARRIDIATSPVLQAEYREVLLRPKLVRRHGWSADVLDALLHAITEHAIVLSPPLGPRAPDPGDQMLWDLLAADPALRLVTADRALLRDRGMIGRVVTASACVADLFSDAPR